jgi:hypothetical protein
MYQTKPAMSTSQAGFSRDFEPWKGRNTADFRDRAGIRASSADAAQSCLAGLTSVTCPILRPGRGAPFP